MILLLIISLIFGLKIVDITIGLTRFTHPAIFFLYFHIVFFYLGLFAVANYENVVRIDESLFSYIVLAFILFCVSVSVIYYILNFITKSGHSHGITGSVDTIDVYTRHSVLIVYYVGCFLYVFFVLKTGFVAFLSNNIEAERIVARKGMGAVTILSINMVTYSGLYLSLCSKKLFYKLRLFVVSGVVLIGFGNRGPFLTFLVLYFIISNAMRKKNLSWYKLCCVAVLVFVLFVALGVLRKGNAVDPFLDLFSASFFWRPFVNIYNFQNILDTFPSAHNFLYGNGFLMDLATLLPGYSANFQTWVKDIIGMDFEGGGVTTTYLGEFYINFGIYGIWIAPIFYAVVFNVVYCFIIYNCNRKITSFPLLDAVLISYALSPVVGSGLFPSILNCVVPLLIIIYSIKCMAYALRVVMVRA